MQTRDAKGQPVFRVSGLRRPSLQHRRQMQREKRRAEQKQNDPSAPAGGHTERSASAFFASSRTWTSN
jgi:hypothetical protein